MMHGDMRTYANGRKKKYNAWGSSKPKQREFVEYNPTQNYRRSSNAHIPSLVVDVHDCSKAAKKEYTGTLVKGISTLHKSNAVPILNQKEAIEHANMRR